jgi:hypothetical protein
MSEPKEPNFFSDDEIWSRGLGWYERLFAAAAPGDLKGEASTHYTKLPTHPNTLPRLQSTLDRPKLIYLIRDPLVRAVSHYMHDWTMGTMSGGIDAALDSHPELIDYGRYGMQIEPYVQAFGASSVLILSLEEMSRDGQGVLDRVGTFLGHPGLNWRDDHERENASSDRIRRFPLHDLLIESRIATVVRRSLVPQGLRDRIKRRRQMSSRPVLSPGNRARLREIFAADRARLSAMFPEAGGFSESYRGMDG